MIKRVGVFVFLFLVSLSFISAELVADWNFDIGANDALGNNHGAFHGNAGLGTTNDRGNVAVFAGSGDWLELPEVVDVQSDESWSYSIWFKLSSLPSVKGDAFLFRYEDAGGAGDAYIYVDDSGNAIKSYDGTKGVAQGIEAGTWYHVVAVRDGARSLKLYVDGELKNERSDFNFDSTGSSFAIFQSDGRNNWVGLQRMMNAVFVMVIIPLVLISVVYYGEITQPVRIVMKI